MKKRTLFNIIILIIIFIMTVVLSGCGQNDEQIRTDESNLQASVISNNERESTVNTVASEENLSDIDYHEPTFVIDSVKYQKSMKIHAICVYVKNNPGIASIAFTLNYDKTKLKLMGYEFNPNIGGQSVPFNSDVKAVKLVWLNLSNNVSGDWKFATLFFEVLNTEFDECVVTLSYDSDDVYNVHEENIAFRVINGAIIK